MFAIIDMVTKRIARKNCQDLLYPTLRGARIAATALNKKSNALVTQYVVMSMESFHRYLDPMVTVYNSITGDGKTPIRIPRSQEGTCCDPSTERYHCM
jgi:hypothetical protein